MRRRHPCRGGRCGESVRGHGADFGRWTARAGVTGPSLASSRLQAVATMYQPQLDCPPTIQSPRAARQGWQLEAAAAFRIEDGRPARLDYRVHCDKAWPAGWAKVRGWIGAAAVDFANRPVPGEWSHDGHVVPGLGPLDRPRPGLQAGHQPAATAPPEPNAGESAEAPAAWIDLGDNSLSTLVQHYERRSDTDSGTSLRASTMRPCSSSRRKALSRITRNSGSPRPDKPARPLRHILCSVPRRSRLLGSGPMSATRSWLRASRARSPAR